MKTSKTADARSIKQVIMVSAWGFTIVVSSK